MIAALQSLSDERRQLNGVRYLIILTRGRFVNIVVVIIIIVISLILSSPVNMRFIYYLSSIHFINYLLHHKDRVYTRDDIISHISQTNMESTL